MGLGVIGLKGIVGAEGHEIGLREVLGQLGFRVNWV